MKSYIIEYDYEYEDESHIYHTQCENIEEAKKFARTFLTEGVCYVTVYEQIAEFVA